MKTAAPTFDWENALVPWALLLGAVLAFGLCCFAGRSTTKENQFTRFKRFHRVLSPEAHFYPTANQVRRLALARTRKDRINVIIGGSSVMNGAFQRHNEVWSDHLGKLLGDDFRVLNLALRAGEPGEFGALTAEMIQNQRDHLIYVTDMFPLVCGTDPDGRNFKYFFWDAWNKGLIDSSLPQRLESVSNVMGNRRGDEKFGELFLGGKWDSRTYFADLWTTLNYKRFGTLWNPVTGANSFKPRHVFEDHDSGPLPLDERKWQLDHGISLEEFKRLWFSPEFTPNASGQWEADMGFLSAFQAKVETAFPNKTLREHTVVAVQRLNAYRIDQLSKTDQAQWSAQIDATRKVLGDLGMRSVEVGKGFTAEDYADYTHFTASGGEKMAELLAPIIREMSNQLGYRKTKTTE
jgi:hypothetical protein